MKSTLPRAFIPQMSTIIGLLVALVVGASCHAGVETTQPTQPGVVTIASPRPSPKQSDHPPQLVAFLNKLRLEGLKRNGPMGFYGRIVDQNQKPVAGIPVEIEFNRFTGIVLPSWEPHQEKAKAISDANGEFGLAGISGVYLAFEPVMPWSIKVYPNMWGAGFGRGDDGGSNPIVYTKANPFIFRAWRMGAPGNIEEGNLGDDMAPNKTYSAVFSSRKLVAREGGDIEFKIQREADLPYGETGPWKVIMGGARFKFRQVTDEEDPFRFLAPSDGYQSEIALGFASKLDKDFNIRPTYYFWIFDGRNYGIINVKVMPFFQHQSRLIISFRRSLKEGDRNLQPPIPSL